MYTELERAVPLSVEGLAVGKKSGFISKPDRAQPNRPGLSATLAGVKVCMQYMSRWDEPGVKEEWEAEWWRGVGVPKGDAEFEPLIAFDRACIEATRGMGAGATEAVAAAVAMWAEAMT